MNYQEFKKSYFKTLTEDMKALDFLKGKSATPTYWRYPCADRRLTWVICYNYSVRGNAIYDILIGPYWESYRLQSADPFPRCVGYSDHLNAGGISVGQSSRSATASSFKQSIQDLEDFGIPYFEEFSSPQELFRMQPTGILAYDLEMFEEALPLFKDSLVRLYEEDYNITSLSKAGRAMHLEDVERSEAYVMSILRRLGKTPVGFLEGLKLDAARNTLSEFEEMLSREPKSRWVKGVIKQCAATIEELGQAGDSAA